MSLTRRIAAAFLRKISRDQIAQILCKPYDIKAPSALADGMQFLCTDLSTEFVDIFPHAVADIQRKVDQCEAPQGSLFGRSCHLTVIFGLP